MRTVFRNATLTALCAAGAISSFAGFTPIALNPSSYNQDPVVEKTAPPSVAEAYNVSMDGGTNKNGNTWFERGYIPTGTNGLPPAGTTVTALSGPAMDRVFVMPPDYHANNVIMVGKNNGAQSPLLGPGKLTLTTPATFGGLSFLTCSGSGPVDVGYRINYSTGSPEEGWFRALDWGNTGTGLPNVLNTAGQVAHDGGIQNLNAAARGAVFAADVPADSSRSIVSVDFWWLGSYASGNLAAGNPPNPDGNGRAVVFAISGTTDGVTYSPITVTGFNYDAVMEADGPATTGTGVAAAGTLTNNVTVTMDGGLTESGSTWFEKGYFSTFPSGGIPPAGSTVTSATYPATYTMPPSYDANCAVFLANNASNATISFSTPAPYGALSFLAGAGGGDTFVPYVITFADGTSETNTLFVPDWHRVEVACAYASMGRVSPTARAVNNCFDVVPDPWLIPDYPYAYDYRIGHPVPRLFDAVITVNNTASAITSISLNYTNAANNRNVSIFAVSGAPVDAVPPVFGVRGSASPGQPNNSVVNSPALLKRYEGTNNIVLAVTNIAGTGPISYQWKKAPRGGGLIPGKMFPSFDYSTFANVVDGGRVSGANTSVLVISNALVADSADYLCVAVNSHGAATSAVATVMMLTTNQSILLGKPAGDVIASYTTDASTAGESIDHVIDRVAQKWLSCGVNPNSPSTGNQSVPFIGPIGYIVTPVSGGTVVTALRFFTANDAQGRDPMDYTLEGSNDGSTWATITGGKLTGTLTLPTGRNGTGSAALDPIAQNHIEVNFANSIGYKSYRLTFTNTMDRLRAPLLQIAEIDMLGTLVANPPVWVRQPEPASTVYAGASPTLYAVASGYPQPAYQWYKGATAIPGATTTAYTFPNTQVADSGATFTCEASNRFGKITSTIGRLTVLAAPSQSYPFAVLADSPVGYWRFNEGPDDAAGNNGKLARDFSGAHNGYYTNTDLAFPGYNPITDADTAARFGQYAITPNSYVAEIKDIDFSRVTNGGRAFSVEAWVYGAAQAANSAIVAKGYNGILTAGTGTGTEQFVLDVLGTPSAFRFLVRDAVGNATVAQSQVLPYDKNDQPVWRHLVGVCDQPNGMIYLYVDGLLAASSTISPYVGILAQPMPMTIGARKQNDLSDYNQQWAGVIDEVALYNTALSSGQVLNHYYSAELAPIITLQPTNTTVAENLTASFYAAARGGGTLGYQWYLSDGTSPTSPVAGQTSPVMAFTATAGQNGNNYQLVVTNIGGASTSSVAQLTVVSGAPSFIVDLPPTSGFGLGHVIRLEIQAGGTAPFTYQWQKNGVNLIDDYRISGSQSNVLTIGYATNADSGNYQVLVSNGATTASAMDAVTVVAPSAVPPFSAAGTGWTLNGAPPMTNNRLELTSGAGGTARAAWANTKIGVGAFNASFVYQTVSGAGGADGVTFCLQNAGLTALGGAGGGMGYSTITPSVALAFNIYASNTRGIRLLTGGTVTTPFFPIDPVLVGGNANPIQVDLNYSGGVLGATFKDTVTAATYTTNFVVDIPGAVGAGDAYVGFTGADGGTVSTQVITDFSMAAKPFALKSRMVGGSLALSWPASAGVFLKVTPTLSNPVWSDCTSQFRVVGDEAQVTIAPLAGDQFYRLIILP